MAVDDSALLPKPPPARADRRHAAVEAALRRFDAVADGSIKPTEGSRPWIRHPAFGLAMAASIAIVIGLPAILVGFRDGGSGPVMPTAEPRAAGRPAPQQSDAKEVLGGADASEPASPPRIVVPPNSLASNSPAIAQADEAPVEAPAAPPPDSAFVAAAPPPPPPAPAHMVAQKSAQEGASEVVVTGSRVRNPALARSDALSVSDSRLHDPAYAAFLSRLQIAVRENDRGAVIKMIQFPLRVNSGGKSRLYRDARSVRRDFDQIFTSRVKQAIAEQRFDGLFVRDQGAMIGNGELWFDQMCSNTACSPPGPVRIRAVNP